jgi:hypothetical protein
MLLEHVPYSAMIENRLVSRLEFELYFASKHKKGNWLWLFTISHAAS